MFVSDDDDLGEADFKAASVRLNESLKTCRAVVENYRSKIGGKRAVASAADDELPASDRVARHREIPPE